MYLVNFKFINNVIASPDDQILFFGWMSNRGYAQMVPTETWRCAMATPRELSLRKIGGSLRLISTPAKQLKQLRETKPALDFAEAKSHSGLPEVMLSIDLKETTATDFGV